MQNSQEDHEFLQWYDGATKRGSARQQIVYGRLVVMDKGKRLRKRPYKIGTLVIAAGGVAFLRKVRPIPAWGILLIVLGSITILAVATAVTLHTDRTPIIIPGVAGFGLYLGILWWVRRPMDLRDRSQLNRSAADLLSAYVPLKHILRLQMCRPPGWANPDHVRIRHIDFDGGERELVLGDMVVGRVNFDAEAFCRELRTASEGSVSSEQPGAPADRKQDV